MRATIAVSALLVLALTACKANREVVETVQVEERAPTASSLEQETFDALNEIRRKPTAFQKTLREYAKRFEGKKMRMSETLLLATNEGEAAIDEALRFLRVQKPVGTLARTAALERAARDHQLDQARTGGLGHRGSDGTQPIDRVRRHAGLPGGAHTGETIAYGSYGGATGRDVILSLIIDDGEPRRGHRKLIFDPGFTLVGVACGSHPRFKRMCTLDFATKLDTKK